jgi:hypothetical protein
VLLLLLLEVLLVAQPSRPKDQSRSQARLLLLLLVRCCWGCRQ